MTELIPVGSHCPECQLPVDEANWCSHIVHFTNEHGSRCGVVVREPSK